MELWEGACHVSRPRAETAVLKGNQLRSLMVNIPVPRIPTCRPDHLSLMSMAKNEPLLDDQDTIWLCSH